MTSDTTTEPANGAMESDVIARSRRRFVGVTAGVLALVVAAAAGWWLQAASQFDIERVRTETQTVGNAMAGMLAMGLPLSDFIGFGPATDRVLRVDRSVKAIEALDKTGKTVLSNPENFTSGNREWRMSGQPAAGGGDTEIHRSGWMSRLSLPVAGRFGGAVTINTYYQPEIETEARRRKAIAGLAAIVLLVSGLAIYGMVIANPEAFQSVRELAAIYLPACVIGAAIILMVLFGLGADKAKETAHAYGESLGARLGEAVSLGIDPGDLAGLDDVVREYQESNDIIAYVALLQGNRIEAATGLIDPEARWSRPGGFYDAVIEVRPRRLYRPQYRVAIGIPWQVVSRVL